MIRESKVYTISCKCGASIVVDKIDKAKDQGWQMHSMLGRWNESSKDFCPVCVEKERQRKYNSSDIWERISAGFYDDNPDKFRDDAIEFVGLKGHPKADKAMAQAVEDGHSGGHSEIFNALIRYAEVLK